MTFLAPAPVARILFDESHGEAWTISAARAAQLQPAHPADSSYAEAAAALTGRELVVDAHRDGPLDAAALDGADVLVIAHPSESRWEKTDGRSPVFAADELDAIETWVRAGGGLVVLGETEQDKYGSNVGDLVARFGIGFVNTTVYDYEHSHGANPAWIHGTAASTGVGTGSDASLGADLLARVGSAAFYRAGALTVAGGAVPVLRTSAAADPAGAPLMAAAQVDAGRVVVLADSDLFGDDCLADLDHRALWVDLITWAGQAAFARAGAGRAPAPVLEDPHWIALKREVDALRLRQEPDGSVASPDEDLRAQVSRISAAVAGLAPRFPHQGAYLDAVVADLAGWADAGFVRPDFGRSLHEFRPDQQRVDDIEHLVLFPMYTQNGSRDTRFEALVVRVPWPDWLADLEQTRYDNAKFVPVTFVDRTAGYDSECAVLFPETFAVAGPVENNFGGIFCDREAERFRRVCGAAADVLGVNLPADAEALLSSPRVSQEAFVLWDLVHDRAHSRGDLPFDPFMIRQRMPYWMYALEELRCDLTAFSEAVRLEAEGFAFARHVQTAILFDRLFRFPVTGTRVRNYDGLGGQLLFGYLHARGTVRWTDNRLRIDWKDVPGAVLGLLEKVEELYRSGIDLPKVRYWMTAHDLVSTWVSPAVTSRWADGAPALRELAEPKAWIDAVEDDEFPLSVFYSQLQPKLRRQEVAA